MIYVDGQVVISNFSYSIIYNIAKLILLAMIIYKFLIPYCKQIICTQSTRLHLVHFCTGLAGGFFFRITAI